MTALERADAYLTIPPAYGESLGGLRWAHGCDAIERADGSTLALAVEFTPLLDGACHRPPCPPFAFVLNVLHLMKSGPDRLSVPFNALWESFTRLKGAPGLHRNAGLLVAELCRGLPGEPGDVTPGGIATALRTRQLYGEHLRPEVAVEPPLTRAEFEEHLADKLRHLDDEALDHWLRHGGPPAGGGAELAEAVESLPVRVAKVLALARRRGRLVGAATLAPALDAALTLPPRRRTPDAVPQGGYVDVTTRGDPDRLLPSQFALDPDEFVRRFAERELLYFQREEPHTAQVPERVIVLDQGVRTWGAVRLGLTAAALALLKRDPKRYGAARLRVTSAGGLNLDRIDPAALAEVLEASDLTATPADALAAALRAPADGPRDVVLLTHPRALHEPDVGAAAKGREKADRVFALALDADGRAELAEWTDGGRVPVRAFRVDLAAGEAARPDADPRPAPKPGTVGGWVGDVEPVPFPFRPGLVGEPLALGFDAAGDCLVVASRDGVLHGLALDGSQPEVLPRAFRNGVVLKQVDAILGVRDGVVVCGRMTVTPADVPSLPVTSASGAPAHVIAHYDLALRGVRLHVVGPGVRPVKWSAFPDLHAVAARADAPQMQVSAGVITLPPIDPGWAGCALDLGTGGRFPETAGGGLVSRARGAWAQAGDGGSPPFTLPVRTGTARLPANDDPFLWLDGNGVELHHADPPWAPFEPQEDGKPLLAGSLIDRAELAGHTLALALNRPGTADAGRQRLVLFRGPDGAVAGEVADSPRGAVFALSRDGRRVAYRRPRREVAACDVGGPPLAVAAPARTHDRLDLRLTAIPFELVVMVGTTEHTFGLHGGELVHKVRRDVTADYVPTLKPAAGLPTAYDPARFPAHLPAALGWWAAQDRLGQVVVVAETGGVVLAVLVRRDQAAAWVPGGVYWGDAGLIGGPPTPDAARKIGQAVIAARGQS